MHARILLDEFRPFRRGEIALARLLADEKAPPFLALFPSGERLRISAAQGEREFEATARVLLPLLAPVLPWKALAPAHVDLI